MVKNNFPIVCRQENHWHLTDANYKHDALLNLQDEYKKYWGKIERGENFALVRYGDGERALMIGKEVHAQEGWQAKNEITLLGRDLKNSLGFSNPNFVYAISCPCCDSEAYYWYLRHLKNCSITFANIFVNANFARFRQDFLNLKRDAVLITNYRGKDKTYGKLNVKRHYTISDDCVKFWAEEAANLIRQIIEETGHEKNLLYAVSTGPMSGLIIKALFENNPDNTYVDFGSAIDFITHDKITRPYMIETTPYAHQKCWMFDNSKMSIEVDVVLSAYKRPQALQQQIAAIRAQTLQPNRILLYQDAVASGSKVVLSNEILSQFDDYEIAEENGGVWKRFEYAAKKATAPYVCVFDDDTIPGRRWLENCHMHSLQKRGGYTVLMV